MGQRRAAVLARFFLLILAPGAVLLATAGCEKTEDRTPATTSASTSAQNSHIKIASLVPAATDLLIGMGAGDNLVAISNYDVDRAETRDLPRVGDYQSVDFERLAGLKPRYLVIFQQPERVPEGMRQQASAIGVDFINVRTETLDDLFAAMHRLAGVLERPELARDAEKALRAELNEVRTATTGKPSVPTLIVRDEKAVGVVGRGTFLNELLEIAGGTNVIESTGWPDIDRERLLSLKPRAVIQLLSAVSPQVEEQARRVWDDLGGLPAVRDGRVYIINEWYTQQPGYHVAELARRMAKALHGDDASAVQP